MNVLFLQCDHPEEMNTSRWRSQWPAEFLATKGIKATHIYDNDALMDATNRIVQWADVLVVEIPYFPAIHGHFARHWRRNGKVVIAQFDDAYHLMPSPERGPWSGVNLQASGTGVSPVKRGWQDFLEVLAEYDFAVVPTEKLGEDVRGKIGDCQALVVPNRMPGSVVKSCAELRRGERVVVGYGGSSQHAYSVLQTSVCSDLARILTEGLAEVDIIARPEIARAIYAAGGTSVKCYEPLVYEAWLRAMSQWHLGLAPLSGEYDRRRSWIKVLEYATAGVPWLATNYEPYWGCPGNVLMRPEEGWYRAIKDTLRMPDEDRAEFVKYNRDWAAQQALEKHGDEWLGVIKLADNLLIERRRQS